MTSRKTAGVNDEKLLDYNLLSKGVKQLTADKTKLLSEIENEKKVINSLREESSKLEITNKNVINKANQEAAKILEEAGDIIADAKKVKAEAVEEKSKVKNKETELDNLQNKADDLIKSNEVTILKL